MHNFWWAAGLLFDSVQGIEIPFQRGLFFFPGHLARWTSFARLVDEPLVSSERLGQPHYWSPMPPAALAVTAEAPPPLYEGFWCIQPRAHQPRVLGTTHVCSSRFCKAHPSGSSMLFAPRCKKSFETSRSTFLEASLSVWHWAGVPKQTDNVWQCLGG